MSEVKDPRSTGRKRGRRVLEQEGFPYFCGSTRDGYDVIKEGYCGRSPTDPDAPGGYYPGMATLQVNHENKNIMDNDPANLTWACASCHKEVDSLTEVGESRHGDEMGYGLDLFGFGKLDG